MSSSEANDRNEWPITPDILGIETATICNKGIKEQEITFHTKPLTRLSPKFAQFCRRKKQPDGRFTLICAQNKYDAFTCMALYAYHGKVPTPPKEIDSNYTQRLRWIYYVAEEFALHDLMNKTIDALRVYDFKHKLEIHIHVEEIYKNTSKGSLLRWYSAASAAWSWGRETGPATSSQRDNRKKFISSGRGNPDIFADFHLVDLFHRDHIRGFDTDWRDVHDSGLPVCAFHCHAPGETCHRTGITEPAEVEEHISRIFDGVEDTVLLDRSQIIDAPSDQDVRLSEHPSTPPKSPETDIHQMEDSNIRSANAENITPPLLGSGHENTPPSENQSRGATNGGHEMRTSQLITVASNARDGEVAKPSPAIPLAPIRNPPSTKVLPPENRRIDLSHKSDLENFKNETLTEDLYGTSDVDMDREDSNTPMKPPQQAVGSTTYDEQLANAWGVPLSSLPPKKTRIVPGTVVTDVKIGDAKRSRGKRSVPDITDSLGFEKDRNHDEYPKMGTKKRKTIPGEDENNPDSNLIITKKSKAAHVGTQAFIKAPESKKISAEIPSEIQDSETESSEEDSSDHSSSDEDNDEEEEEEEEEEEDDDDAMIDEYSSEEEEEEEEESSYEEEESISHREIIPEDHESSSSSSPEPEPEPGAESEAFHDSGIHSHTSSKTTSTSLLTHSQPAPINPLVSACHTRSTAGIAPLRPGYCLIYNYKGRCNKACGLQHLCLKCDLQHSSLHHEKYQPNFRATNIDASIETCPDWNAGRCAVRVTNCTLRHVCGVCLGGHRSIYHEHGFEDDLDRELDRGYGGREVTFSNRHRTLMESKSKAKASHFHLEGRLDHHHDHDHHHSQHQHIPRSTPSNSNVNSNTNSNANWSSLSHSLSLSHPNNPNPNPPSTHPSSQKPPNPTNHPHPHPHPQTSTSTSTSTNPNPYTSCPNWQRGTCIRKRTRCQLPHICERCGQLTHRTAKHDMYMSKTAPRG
ncbi:hypothetical protein NHQ30_008930 [Ciborinia camelliae]|nr:hypothetical protein NHQ30_008930 [Ciborinia camelliae]